MKRLNNWALLLLVIVMSLALVACGGSANNNPTDDNSTTAPDNTTGAPVSNHQHCICGLDVSGAAVTGHDHSAENVAWEEWPGVENVTAGGNYYLTENVTINWPEEPVCFNLCLNGFNVSQDKHINVEMMTICDCAENPGKITSTFSSDKDGGGVAYIVGELNLFRANLVYAGTGVKNGGCVRIPSCATFNLHSGSLSGGLTHNPSESNGEASGGSIHMSGNFNMYGGKMSAATETRTARNGGNIWSNGSIYITGDSVIEGGSATYGGVIRIDSGTFIMEGGVIQNGVASKSGGNIYFQNCDFQLKGNAVVKNGTAGNLGGNILMYKAAGGEYQAFIIKDNATIMDGTAPVGANISLHATNINIFKMEGGKITGGTVSFGAAIAKITGGYLQLAEDLATTADITIKAESALTIDLNGKTLSGEVNAGDKLLTVTDSSADKSGKLTATVTGTLATPAA